VDNRPIGVFDSGVGGLSVVRELRQLLPGENVVYFADQAHCPYGNRSVEEIQTMATAATRRLLAEGSKLVVIACNTATTTSLATLRDLFAVPFVGVVPAVKPASRQTRTGVIAVLATEATLKSPGFEALVKAHALGTQVLRRACPDLVTLVERSELDSSELAARIRAHILPLQNAGVDQLVLGCTHFEFIRQAVERIVGPGIPVLGTVRAVAEQTAKVLRQNGLESPEKRGWLKLTTSGEPSTFLPLARRLLQIEPE